MLKTKKEELIRSYRETASKANFTILADYSGVPFEQLVQIRKKVIASGGSIMVVKNSLFAIAVKGSKIEVLADKLIGPNQALVGTKDPVGIAKAFIDFAKETEKYKFKAATLEGKLIDESALKALASLPTKEVLVGRLLGTLQAPIAGFVSLLHNIPQTFVMTLAAIKDSKEKSN